MFCNRNRPFQIYINIIAILNPCIIDQNIYLIFVFSLAFLLLFVSVRLVRPVFFLIFSFSELEDVYKRQALMLPVAALPICGILMGLGYAIAPGVMGVPGAATSGALYNIGFLLSLIHI